MARAVPDLLTPLATAESLEAGLVQTLKRLVSLAGGTAGVVVVRPHGSAPVVVKPRHGRNVLNDVLPEHQHTASKTDQKCVDAEAQPGPQVQLKKHPVNDSASH